MKSNFVMLADFDPNDPLSGQMSITDPRLYPMLIMLGALAVAALLAGLWAIRYSRKKKQRKERTHHHAHSKTSSAAASERKEPVAETKVRKKWKRQRRPHRPLNPTLAQTGGLPPMRDEDTPLPPMP